MDVQFYYNLLSIKCTHQNGHKHCNCAIQMVERSSSSFCVCEYDWNVRAKIDQRCKTASASSSYLLPPFAFIEIMIVIRWFFRYKPWTWAAYDWQTANWMYKSDRKNQQTKKKKQQEQQPMVKFTKQRTMCVHLILMVDGFKHW